MQTVSEQKTPPTTLRYQAYAAEQKAAKLAAAAEKGRCDQYKIDKNGRCPGDTGYVSFVKEDVPKDFAVSKTWRPYPSY